MSQRTDPLPPKRLLVQLSVVLCLAYGAWIALNGPHYGPDSQTYSRWADLLIAMRFDVAAFLREQSFITPPVFYILWTLTLAILKSTLGSSWAIGVLALNWLSIGWGAFVTLERTRSLTGSAAGMLLAALLLLLAADLLLFAPFVLSDLVFWAVSTTVIGTALRLTTNEDGRPRTTTIVVGSVLTVVALLFRPVGIPLAVMWLLAVVSGRVRAILDRFGPAVLAAAAAAAIAAVVVHAYLLMHPDRWPFGPVPAFLALLSDEYHRGVLVYAPESDLVVRAATTVPGAMRLTLQKLLYFLTPWLPHYSASHTLLNIVFFVPAYGLSAVALARRKRLPPPQARAAVLLATYIMALSAFHAMMQIEFDHRYRLPMLPVLIMLSAIGLEAARRPQMLASTVRKK